MAEDRPDGDCTLLRERRQQRSRIDGPRLWTGAGVGLGRPRIHVLRVLLAWITSATALLIAAWLVPGAAVGDFGAALAAAVVIAALSAVLPPIVAAVRLPYTALLGFVVVLVLDAFMLLAADDLTDGLSVGSFWTALGVALVATAVSVLLHVVLGTNDDDTYMVRVIQRIARRSGKHPTDSTPRGSSSSRSTGWRCPSCSGRCGTRRECRRSDRVRDRIGLGGGARPVTVLCSPRRVGE